jgi:hypothetical protein
MFLKQLRSGWQISFQRALERRKGVIPAVGRLAIAEQLSAI